MTFPPRLRFISRENKGPYIMRFIVPDKASLAEKTRN
ncbi:hypothetical protein X474_20210 [Dethiosulfatarculus sandiegensis]|uniref:Uncharacterized protein n=1 Tax=Dethiosulfatarculus sandiegensis TaxID=1429043 RepID=A0A0D2JS06_9BACT|nr:hypothetical protein X474_20210 [Dethiosulfatarculus sandiegensis]